MIQSLRFEPETLDWITSALKDSHQDEKGSTMKPSSVFRTSTVASRIESTECMSISWMVAFQTSSSTRSQRSSDKNRLPFDRTSSSTSKRIRVTYRRASRFSNWPILRQNSLKSSQAVRNADCSISYYRTRLGATAS